jgi:hypothetical protein
MAYTPELSKYHSSILRWITWACKMPMTKTLADIFDYLGKTLDSIKICDSCKDKSVCKICAFKMKEVQKE